MSNGKVSASVSMDLVPWVAPNFAYTEEGDSSEKIHLSRLDDGTILALARIWLEELYRNAGREHIKINLDAADIRRGAIDEP